MERVGSNLHGDHKVYNHHGETAIKKWPILVMVLCLGVLGQNLGSNNKRSVLVITPHSFAWGFEQNGATHMQRIVAMNNKVLTISADEMKYDPDNQEIQLRGNVRVKLN